MNIGLLTAGCLCDLTGILALLYSVDLFLGSSAVGAARAKATGAAAIGVVLIFVGATCLRAAIRNEKVTRGQTPDGNA